MSDLVIRSRRIVTPGGIVDGTVVVRGERIVEIASGDVRGPEGAERVDATAHVVMPAVVDCHAHINEPGRTEWEGFESATRAAAAGGIATVIDMPLNSIPATTSLAALRIKADTAKGHCAIDYGFWGGVVPGNAGELEAMVEAGALGFKAFLCPSGVDEFPQSTRADLDQAMPHLARAGVPLLVHAELESAVPPLTSAADGTGSGDARAYATYLRSRPRAWENAAIKMMIDLCREHRCRVHIVHLSSAEALGDIRRAKDEGLPFTVETCPHYLTFSAEEIEAGATHFKCAPPIREAENRERLWDALKDGTIDFVVSDHSPCTPALKKLKTGDFGAAWGGIAGLQFSLPAVWTGMKRRGMGLEALTRLMCERTAAFIGVTQTKGRIAPGNDADLVVFDPDATFTPEERDVHHRHKLTPYCSGALCGRVRTTFLRGQRIFDDGTFSRAPSGHQVRRDAQASAGR